MRIRSIFMLSIALGSTIGIVTALLFALQQWSAFQTARTVQHDMRLLSGMLRLPEAMNFERAYINPRLVAPTIATPTQMVIIRRQTDLVDAALLDAKKLVETPADAATLQALQTELLPVRRAALDAITRPRTERPIALDDAYLKQMFAIQEDASSVASAVYERINTSSPRVGRAARLALLAWDLRDWAGRQTTTLIGYIAVHLPMAGEQAETLAIYKGRLESQWRAMQSFAASIHSQEVTAALKGVERGFWAQGGEAYTTQVVPNRGRTLDLDPDRFVAFIRPILDTILPLRDSALKEALQQSDAEITVRRMRFLLALGLLVLTTCTAAAATHWFNLKVVRPIEQITAIIRALADGDRDVHVPLRGRTDELGEMAQAIEALRCNAVEAEAIAQEILALQKARADEKSRLLTQLMLTNQDLAAINRELESLAGTDALTGVPNRRSFDFFLSREWRRAQREEVVLGLLMLDVDHFKAFNDRYGHPAGDVCLVRVATAVMNAARRPGDITARYGGEEFAVILPVTGLEGAIHVAERIRCAVAGLNIPHEGSSFGFVTVSIGVALIIPQPSDTLDALVSRADTALYASKRAGRNQVTMKANNDDGLERYGYGSAHDSSRMR